MTNKKHLHCLLFLSLLSSFMLLAQAQAAQQKSAPRTSNVVATVNGENITREDLAKECLRHYGESVLESLINVRLVEQACEKNGIKISSEEIDAEIQKMATQFGIPVEQWYKMLMEERGITPEQYREMVWMILAQKKLAGAQMQVTNDEIQKEYETQFGPAVKARLIAVEDPKLAQNIRAKAVENPDQFANLAKQYSVDTVSASSKGWVPPIRKHSTLPALEDAAFTLKDGQISQVIPFGDTKQYIIIKREGMIPARDVPLEQVAPDLKRFLEQKKLQRVGHSIAKKLQEEAKIENYIKDPQKANTGIAAVLNGKKVTVRDLAEECIKRHGEEALDGAIARRLIEQACKKNGVTISEDDLRKEIANAALLSLPPKKDGSPDVEQWLKLATEEQGISQEVYVRDSVWPSVALKKLVGDSVQISDEDLTKGFEANYGPRAECLAIVLDNLRRAQHVWGLAQKNPSVAHFGDLAEQYSIEPSSKKLRGEIPPIQMHGGQPKIEKEAFTLKPGELSSIIHVPDNTGDKYVILLCKGHTEPMNVNKEEVRALIYEDLHEKKLRIEMGDYFQKLKDLATVENYLTGETQSPKKQGPSASSVRRVKIN